MIWTKRMQILTMIDVINIFNKTAQPLRYIIVLIKVQTPCCFRTDFDQIGESLMHMLHEFLLTKSFMEHVRQLD